MLVSQNAEFFADFKFVEVFGKNAPKKVASL